MPARSWRRRRSRSATTERQERVKVRKERLRTEAGSVGVLSDVPVIENLIAGIVAAGLVIYLVVALIHPDRW